MKYCFVSLMSFFCFSMHAMDRVVGDVLQKPGPSEYAGPGIGDIFAFHLHAHNFEKAMGVLDSLNRGSGMTVAFLQSATGPTGDTPLHCVSFLLGKAVYEKNLSVEKLEELQNRLLQLGARKDALNFLSGTPEHKYRYGMACAAASLGIKLDLKMLRRGRIAVALPHEND
ncbi:hypothetical protein JW872_03360 [Candidatus Babeliales bacterium]|nr:hypothetical protein [Candidatus Babeliales bacterium]